MARLYSARPAGTQGSGADTIPGRNASTSSGSPTTAAASPRPPAPAAWPACAATPNLTGGTFQLTTPDGGSTRLIWTARTP
jgi:hypothetical protein